MVSVVNTWNIHTEKINKTNTLIEFLVPVEEEMICEGTKVATIRRLPRRARPLKEVQVKEDAKVLVLLKF